MGISHTFNKIKCAVLEKTIHLRNSFLDKIRGEPDVMVLGEDSLDLHQAHLIAKMIKRHEPEYVLFGAFGNISPERAKSLVDFYKIRTLKDLCKHHGVSLEDLGVKEDILREIRGRIDEELRKKVNFYEKQLWTNDENAVEFAKKEIFDEGHVPRNSEELKNTLLYFLHPVVLDILRKKVRDGFVNNRVSARMLVDMGEHLRAHERTGSIADVMRDRRYDVILSAVADVGARPVGCYADDPKKERVMHRKIKGHLGKRSSNAPIMAIILKKYADNIGKKLKETGIKHRVIKLPPVSNDSARILHRK